MLWLYNFIKEVTQIKMSKDVGLTYQDLCELIAKKCYGQRASATSVDKYLKGIYKTHSKTIRT